MTITIYGQTPAQKNSKTIAINRRTGKPFPMSNKRVKDWQKNALEQLESYDVQFRSRIQIDYMFYVKDDVQRDIDNMVTTINDILQAANAEKIKIGKKEKIVKGTGIIKGDNWQLLRIGSADAEIDRSTPRAEMIITEL